MFKYSLIQRSAGSFVARSTSDKLTTQPSDCASFVSDKSIAADVSSSISDVPKSTAGGIGGAPSENKSFNHLFPPQMTHSCRAGLP